MDTMIERVARAIARGRHGLGDSAKENELAIDYHWPKYQSDSRAAIAAMREPTDAMIRAGNDEMTSGKQTWQAMIDAALQEYV